MIEADVRCLWEDVLLAMDDFVTVHRGGLAIQRLERGEALDEDALQDLEAMLSEIGDEAPAAWALSRLKISGFEAADLTRARRLLATGAAQAWVIGVIREVLPCEHCDTLVPAFAAAVACDVMALAGLVSVQRVCHCHEAAP